MRIELAFYIVSDALHQKPGPSRLENGQVINF